MPIYVHGLKLVGICLIVLVGGAQIHYIVVKRKCSYALEQLFSPKSALILFAVWSLSEPVIIFFSILHHASVDNILIQVFTILLCSVCFEYQSVACFS